MNQDKSQWISELGQVAQEVSTLHQKTDLKNDIHLETDYQRCLTSLCYCIERILEYGLRDNSLFGTGSYFWDVLKNLDTCLPGSKDVMNFLRTVKDCSLGRLGKGRMFIRLGLNQGCLGEYLTALAMNVNLMQENYHDWALMRDQNVVTALLSHLDTIKSIPFTYTVNDPRLDDPQYWPKLARLRKAMGDQNGSPTSPTNLLSAPPNLLRSALSSPSISIETVNNLVKQAEVQSYELETARNHILELKIQLEKEKKEKESLKDLSSALEENIKVLLDRMKDMEIELSVWKSQQPHHDAPHGLEHVDSFQLINDMKRAIETEDWQEEEPEENGVQEISNGIVDHDEVVTKLQNLRQFVEEMKESDRQLKEKLLRSSSADYVQSDSL